MMTFREKHGEPIWKSFFRLLPVAALWIAILFGTLSAGAEAVPPTEDDETEWTVMLYMCGSDLESRYSYATGNLEELSKTFVRISEPSEEDKRRAAELGMELKPEKEKVQVVLATGGTKEWHAQSLGLDIPTDRIQYWQFRPATTPGKQGQFLMQKANPLESMAKGQTLTDFIQWGAENYPAKKYMLVLWDHGGGSKTGIFIDELFNGDIMYLDELKAAMEAGGVHFDTILFDACLMANLETAYAVHSMADWMVGSEEVVAGKGTAVGAWLQLMYNLPQCDGRQAGRWICETTQIKYANEDDEQARELLTWSVIDLSRIEELVRQFDLLFQTVGLGYKYRPEMDTSSYKFILEADFYGSGEENMFDLASMLYNSAISESPFPGILWNLIDCLTEVVDYSLQGDGRASARGLSFCYAADFSVRELENYSRNCPSPHYLALLDAISPWSAPEEIYEQVERLPEMSEIPEFKVKVNKQIFRDGTPAFTIEEGYDLNVGTVIYNIYRLNEETGQMESLGNAGVYLDTHDDPRGIYRIYDLWNWPAIDGMLCQIELLTVPYQGHYDSLINIPVRIGKDVWNLRSGYRAKDQAYTVYGLWEGFDSESNMFNRNVKTLAQFVGQEFRLLYEIAGIPGAQGKTYAASDPMRMTRELKVDEIMLPPGKYEIEYVVKDLFNRSMKLEPLMMQWDGSQMELLTDGWEGSEMLSVNDYYEDNP